MFNNPRLSLMLHDKRKTLKLEVQIRNALHRLTILITTMDDELSLVPVSVSLAISWRLRTDQRTSEANAAVRENCPEITEDPRLDDRIKESQREHPS
jgi:hypothetical protein